MNTGICTVTKKWKGLFICKVEEKIVSISYTKCNLYLVTMPDIPAAWNNLNDNDKYILFGEELD
jgi:hypothetical protein